MTTGTNYIKKNLPILITILSLFGIMGLMGLVATSFSSPYVARMVKITSGSPPNAELEIRARKEGAVNIKIELFRKGNLAASGTYRLSMFDKQTEVVVIPLNIKSGYTTIFGETASYTSIKVSINNKRINWKWKK